MAYKLLSSLFYESKQEYQELYQKRINSENCIHLNFKIHNNNAFYCLTSDTHHLYAEILKTNHKVQQLINTLPRAALHRFAENSLINEIIQTNNIEGVHSTRKEINGVLLSLEKKDKKKRFYGLVNKYNLMVEEQIDLKSCDDIRAIYNELVLQEVKTDDPNNAPDGKLFRKEMAEVVTATDKIIHHGVYPEDEIISSMESALLILNNDEILPIERIALFHYLFGYIHPFYDGNGRVSRFISSYLLSRELDNPLIGYRLSYTIKENISSYYKAFEICNNKNNRGDLTPFVIMFLKTVKTSMQNLYIALKKRYDDLIIYIEKIEKSEQFNKKEFKNICFVLIQANLFSDNGITLKELTAHLNISESTIKKRLNTIDQYGYLIKNQISRCYYYKFDVYKLSE